MAIFGQFQGGDNFNVAGNMRDVLKGQQNIHDSMMGAVEKFNNARQEMEQLQAVSGSILGQYGVDEKGNPDPSAPKYVHDMFKAVNKEGGLANMSKSQMLAGLKAYETGYGLEQQKLQQDAARENIRGANIANTAKEIELKRLQEAIADENRIKEARKAKQAEIDAIAKGKLETAKEFQEVKFGEEKVKIKTTDLQPLLERLAGTKDANEQTQIKSEIAKLIYNNSRFSKELSDDWETVIDDKTGERTERQKKNLLYREFKSPYDESAPARYDSTGKLISKPETPSTLSKGLVDSYISGELRKFKETKAKEEVAVDDTPLGRLKRKVAENQKALGPEYKKNTDLIADSIEVLQREIALGASPIEINNIIERLAGEMDNAIGTKVVVGGDEAGKGSGKQKAFEQTKKDWLEVVNGIRAEMGFGDKALWGYWSSDQKGLRGGSSLYAPSELVQMGRLPAEGRGYDTGVITPEQRLKAIDRMKGLSEAFGKKATIAAKPSTPYETGELSLGKQSGWEEQYVTKEIQRSVTEQTDDEYNLMVNYLKSSGGVPVSFTKDAFYASKGILRPTVMDLGNGQTYVKIGGVEKIVENKNSASQMTIMDQKRLFDAQQMSKQRNMNGLSVNGYNFSGELRVGDIDQANKVRDGVFKTTRALSAVDQMINIAENASMFSKLMPTEISGIAQSLTNAAQSANRTEIGGSGSWSNQDQIYMDKIIRDPSSGFNSLFTSQTIASLKEYRKRLEMSMHDAGTVYGFAFERGGNTGADGLDSQRQQFRVRYSMYLGQGLDRESALQRAISDTEADYE